MAFGTIVLIICQLLGTRYGLGRKFYPGDDLDEVEMRRGAENVVHADREIEPAGTIKVGTVLCVSCQPAVTQFHLFGYVLQHLCIGGRLVLQEY